MHPMARRMPVPVGAGWAQPIAPWTPADIANLSAFFWFKPGVGSCFTDEAGTVAAVAGDPVKNCTGLFGASILKATEATNPPTLRADGLEFSADGADQLTPSADIALSGTGSTVYTVQIAITGQICPILNHTSGQAFVSGDGVGATVQSDSSVSGAVALTQNALSVFRMNIDAAGKAWIDTTGEAGQLVLTGFDACTYDLIAGTGANAGNDSTANRYVLIIAIGRDIAVDSAEDILIRAWITDNVGASL